LIIFADCQLIQTVMKILKRIGLVILILVFLFVLFLVYATISDYKPPEKVLIFESENPDTLDTGNSYSFLLWNIGYSGLGKDMDFFYDGGSQVRTSEETTNHNLQSIKQYLSGNDSCQFILLQEVDQKSKRTYGINEVEEISNLLSSHNPCFALNYKVKYVPVPPTSPMGKVNSGLLTLSQPVPSSSTRFNFPGDYSWPTNLFMLDRCFLVNRYPLSDGKEFLVINSHNSAFDDGSLKAAEMDYLKTLAMSRLVLDNVTNIQVSWVTMGSGVAQVALQFGANDFGSTMIEENVVAAAGVRHRLSVEEIRKIIRDAGYEPRQRNMSYKLINDPATR